MKRYTGQPLTARDLSRLRDLGAQAGNVQITPNLDYFIEGDETYDQLHYEYQVQNLGAGPCLMLPPREMVLGNLITGWTIGTSFLDPGDYWATVEKTGSEKWTVDAGMRAHTVCGGPRSDHRSRIEIIFTYGDARFVGATEGQQPLARWEDYRLRLTWSGVVSRYRHWSTRLTIADYNLIYAGDVNMEQWLMKGTNEAVQCGQAGVSGTHDFCVRPYDQQAILRFGSPYSNPSGALNLGCNESSFTLDIEVVGEWISTQ